MKKNNKFFKKLLSKELTKEKNKDICEMLLKILQHDYDKRDLKFVNHVLNKYSFVSEEYSYTNIFMDIQIDEDFLIIKDIPEKTLNILKLMSSHLVEEKEQTL